MLVYRFRKPSYWSTCSTREHRDHWLEPQMPSEPVAQQSPRVVDCFAWLGGRLRNIPDDACGPDRSGKLQMVDLVNQICIV